MSKFFAPVPLDFDRLFQRDAEITPGVYALGCHLAAESYRRRNTDGGIVEVFAASLAELFEVDKTTIHRRLRILEQKGQIRCEVEERQRRPWRIALTGLANPLNEDNWGATAAYEGLPVQQSSERPVAVGEAENTAPQEGLGLDSEQFSQQSSDYTNEPNRTKPSGKGKLDHDVGKTTAAEPVLVDDLEPDFGEHLDEREQDPFHENGARPERPLPGDDDFLDCIAAVHRAGQITTAEALEREGLHRLVLARREGEF